MFPQDASLNQDGPRSLMSGDIFLDSSARGCQEGSCAHMHVSVLLLAVVFCDEISLSCPVVLKLLILLPWLLSDWDYVFEHHDRFLTMFLEEQNVLFNDLFIFVLSALRWVACLYVCMEGIRSPGTRVTDNMCEQPCGYWELNQVLLKSSQCS